MPEGPKSPQDPALDRPPRRPPPPPLPGDARRAHPRASPPTSRRPEAETALRRMFERDKDELRALRHPDRDRRRTSEDEADGLPARRPRLLPALPLAPRRRPAPPAREARTSTATPRCRRSRFEPEELDAVAACRRPRARAGRPAPRRARRVRPAEARGGPARGRTAPHGTHVVPRRARRPTPSVFAALGEALEGRKRVTFRLSLHGRATPTGRRTVEPFGLFFLNQHWYLAARAPGRDHGQELPREPDRRARGQRPRRPARRTTRSRPAFACASTPAPARPGSWATGTRSRPSSSSAAPAAPPRPRAAWARRWRATRTAAGSASAGCDAFARWLLSLRGRPGAGIAGRAGRGIPRRWSSATLAACYAADRRPTAS